MNKNYLTEIICILLSVLILCSCAGNKDKPEQDMADQTETLVKTLDFDGKEMDYFRFGKQDGRKLVILPGLSLKSVMGSAEAVVAAYGILAEEYDIYLFDHIRKEPDGYSIEHMADDTVSAIKKLELDRVSIIGVSLGGMIGETIAIRYPDLVEGLIVCSSTSRITDSERAIFETWKKLALDRDTDKLMESFGEHVYSPSFYEQYKDIIIASGQGADEDDFHNFIISTDAILNFNIYDQLDRISCPVFVIGAGKDKALGVQASYDIADKLKCEYYIYDDYGHGAYDEAPDYLARVKGFLDKQ